MGYSLIAKKRRMHPMSHKKRDWSKYNKSLVNRGSITLWLSPETLKSLKAKKVKGKAGRPFRYSDSAILVASTIRHVFKLSLRACEGFIKSIFHLLKSNLKVPCYTQICKRSKKISLPKHFLKGKKVQHIVLDATGLKVYGEGEWKVKKHGPGKRRQWRKLHLAVDEGSQEIIFADITTEHIHDTTFVSEVIKNRKGLKRLVMDGAADSSSIYKLCEEHGIELLTPPQKNARLRTEPHLEKRNCHLLEILGLGEDKIARSIWGKLTGYSKRSTVESAIARWKKLFGQELKGRIAETQRLEVKIKSTILNEMKNQERLLA